MEPTTTPETFHPVQQEDLLLNDASTSSAEISNSDFDPYNFYPDASF